MDVWTAAEADLLELAELKLAVGDPLTTVDLELLAAARPDLLAPSFDD